MRSGREKGVRMETGLLSTDIKYPKTVPKKKIAASKVDLLEICGEEENSF